MASQHDYIDKVKTELQAMRDTGILSEQQHARAIRYVANNGDMVAEMAHMEGIQDTVDNVVTVTATCVAGNCEE